MLTITTRVVGWVRAGAITIWPVVFISPDWTATERLVIEKHEAVHGLQQRRWFYAVLPIGLVGWSMLYTWTLPGAAWYWWLASALMPAVGLLAWHAAYLLFAPVARNPFREKWEREAYRATGYTDAEIDAKLREAPYYLWLLK